MQRGRATFMRCSMKGWSLMICFSAIFLLGNSTGFGNEDFIRKGGNKNISFLSGGVGVQEREILKEMGKDYPLKLIFSNKKGEYLSNVMVRLLDHTNHPILVTLSNGPWLFINLPAGTYHLEATVREDRKIISGIEISEGRRNIISVTW